MYRKKTTKPEGPITGKIVDGCYASCLNDCDGKISKEHFLAECALVEVFGLEPIEITGWLSNDLNKTLPLTAKNAFAKILCERHNNALGNIDDTIKKWMQCVKNIHEKSVQHYININSREMSLIILQIACGLIAHHKKPVPKLWVEILFSMIDHNLDLYQAYSVGDFIANEKRIQPIILEIGGNPIGCYLKSKGFTLGTFVNYKPQAHHHPYFFPAKKIFKEFNGSKIPVVYFR